MKTLSLIPILTIAFFAGCVSNPSRMPQNPKDKQGYTDANGNYWIYNLTRGCWSTTNAHGNSYDYYPSTGKFTNNAGMVVTPPANVSSGIRPVNSQSANSHANSSKAVFGSTGKSISVSA